MSSSQHVFDENDEDNEDMEDPPENPAMLQEDLQTSSADHIAGAGGPAAFFQQPALYLFAAPTPTQQDNFSPIGQPRMQVKTGGA